MTHILIDYENPKLRGQEILWNGKMVLPDGEIHEVFFEFSYPEIGSFQPSIRPFLLAFLLCAMRAGLPIVSSKPVDQTTLNNLNEWEELNALWYKDDLKCIPLEIPVAETLSSHTLSKSGAITAFSGGVDSCFTVSRHSQGQAKTYRRTPLQAGLMVAGFDIPLDQPETFHSAWQRSAAILENFDVKPYYLRTNIRQIGKRFKCLWGPQAHGIWLAAALSCYESWFNPVIIPSSYIFEKLRLPWGSNPITDPLFSSATSAFWHDGAAYNKLTKVEHIAHNPYIQNNLRVCWQGGQLDRNCGKCRKCISTQICLWLSGVNNPSCFPISCTLEEIADVNLKDPSGYLAYLYETLKSTAEDQGKYGLAKAINKALKRHRNTLVQEKIRKSISR
jgi:hypothetical protein